jgi:hypothetical protein
MFKWGTGFIPLFGTVTRQILRLGFRVLGKKSSPKYGTQKRNETPIGLGKCCQG